MELLLSHRAEKLGELPQEPLEGSDLLTDDAPAPQPQSGSQLRVGCDDLLQLGDGVRTDRILAELVDESTAQEIVQGLAQRHPEVDEQPEGDVGLEQAFGPVQWPQPLVEVAQDVSEALGRPQGVDAVATTRSKEATSQALMRSRSTRAVIRGARSASLA